MSSIEWPLAQEKNRFPVEHTAAAAADWLAALRSVGLAQVRSVFDALADDRALQFRHRRDDGELRPLVGVEISRVSWCDPTFMPNPMRHGPRQHQGSIPLEQDTLVEKKARLNTAFIALVAHLVIGCSRG